MTVFGGTGLFRKRRGDELVEVVRMTTKTTHEGFLKGAGVA